jgi:predicted MFS family arabinose efflux permease
MTHPQPVSSKSSIAPYAWVILAVVYFASVVAPFNQFKIPPILPALMQTFQIDLIQAGLLMSIIAMIGLVLALPTGLFLQRLGAKVTILIALALMALGACIGAFSNSFMVLLGSRVVEGLGMGLMGVAAPATIAMWFPPDRQGTPMGIWATWVPVGSVVIFNLSPMMLPWFGWQSIWWAGAGFAVVMIIISGWLITRPPGQEANSFQSPAMSNLRQALANRDIWLLALEFACMNFAMVALSTYYPTFLNKVRGYSLGEAGFLASVTSLAVLFSAPAAGWFSDKIHSRRLVLALPFLASAIWLIFPFHAVGWQITVFMVLQGLFLGAIPTATFATAPEVMGKPEWAGLGLAVVLLGQNLGQLLGPIFFSQMVGSFGWAIAGYLLIPFCLIGFFSSWVVKIR